MAECSASWRLELREAARILVLELHPGRAVGVFLGKGFDAVLVQEGRDGGGLGAERFLLAFLRAIAAAGDDQRQGACGVAEAEMQRREAAHRQADHMRLADAQVVQHGGDVVRGAGLGVACRIVRDIGRRIAARGVADRAVALAEMPHLRFPGAVVAGEFMHEDQRRAGAGFLIVQADPVIGRGEGHVVPPGSGLRIVYVIRRG